MSVVLNGIAMSRNKAVNSSCHVFSAVFLKKTVLLLLWIFIPLPSISQDQVTETPHIDVRQYFRFDTTESLEFLITLFPSFLIQNGIELKEFIRCDEFKRVRAAAGDLKAIDAIYVRAMQLTRNNTGIALLLTTLATFDHRVINFDVPLVLLALPLSDESEGEYKARVNNLPTQLFPDSPRGLYGDRDKLQHFFGSAFITFAFESRDVSERFGETIEQGEQAFIIGGVNDDRDVRTNFIGQEFGLALMENPFRYPSEFFRHAFACTDSLTYNHNLGLGYGIDSCR